MEDTDTPEATPEDNEEFKELEAHILPILIWPNKKLNRKSLNVEKFGSESIRQFVLDLFATMHHNEGIGLAAPQVGIQSNIIVLRLEEKKPMLLINPEIIESSDTMYEFEEGCLSVPGYFDKRERPNKVVIKFQDSKGEPHETEFHGIYAFAIQHEIDHLRGKLFVDGLSRLKLAYVERKVKKATKKR